ncbi:MAG: hypothetical protein PHY54_20240 [Methylococcales bacterium]|nr:hypothetical protein [Methylococcales bacterium]
MQEMPWELNSDLNKDRLIAIASIIAKKRGDVIELHDEIRLKDTPRGLGMRCYECCRSEIIYIAESNIWSWLSILTPEGRFTFCIENTPVRFSRNDPKYLPNRKLVTSFETQKQMDWINEHSPYAEIRWFIVFDTHFKSPADAVYFVGYTETNEIICQWQIPLEDKVTLISGVNAPLSQPVDVPPAPIKLKNQPPETGSIGDES